MLEAIGLLLAILDFFDLTSKIEGFLDALRVRLTGFFEVFGALAIKSDQELATETKAQTRVRSIVMAIVCGIPSLLFSAFFAYGSISSFAQGTSVGLIRPGEKAFGLIPSGGVGELLCGLVLTPFIFVTIFFLTGMLLVLCTTAVYYLALVPLIVVLHVIDKAPRGTVGSVGLILAVIGFLTRFVHG